ncbi:MAG: hypothetical protein KJZ69_09510 [Phycisphaerales bacterium]|nr:hypothetical protein [Phycisphaerales bacterium]
MIAQREKQVRNRSERLGNGRFAPGVSGNPRGRPRAGASLAELIRAELDRPMRGGRTRKERLAEVIVERALDGDHRFCRLILERVEPSQDASAGESLSADEWIRIMRIGADIPYQSEESRRVAQRLVEAIDAYERQSEAEEAEAEDEPLLSSEPYRRDIDLRSPRQSD